MDLWLTLFGVAADLIATLVAFVPLLFRQRNPLRKIASAVNQQSVG